MQIGLSTSPLANSRWYEYVIRFVLGGAVTVFTGMISSEFGAAVGGLFLALPAIFCASATLIERHEIRRKREAGGEGARRGRGAAALDATGAALGSVAMIAFAVVLLVTTSWGAAAAFACASLAWVVIAVAMWVLRWIVKREIRRARARR